MIFVKCYNYVDILNSICQVVAHLDSWFKSCCNVVWSSGVFMVLILYSYLQIDEVGFVYHHKLCH